MHPCNQPMARWSTSAFGEKPGPSQQELAELAKHVKQCRSARGPMYFLRSTMKATSEIIASRLWTTVAVVALALLLVSVMSAI